MSGTTLQLFNPKDIPYQIKVVNLIRRDWDYSKGNPEILLSGSYGSAKSILMAHLAVTHCLFNPKARVLLARKALPDLKDTIFKEIIEHIEEDLVEGDDYRVNNQAAKIIFKNGSEIISRSWSDKKYNKGRSLKISFLVFEELTENNEEDKQAFMTMKARLRRLTHVKENVLIAATNPDDPTHWVYKYFFDKSKDTRFVFKSVTTDNPFLDPIYIQQLKDDLDPLSAKRYIYGEWVSLYKDRVYYNYDPDRNFINKDYVVNKAFPIDIMHDFNIGKGKPMSSCVGQNINGVFHVYKVFHVEGSRTLGILEDMMAEGVFIKGMNVRIFGDASGDSNDTRSKLTDYDIIEKFLNDNGINFEREVPLSNPPIRSRHNKVNATFMSESGKVRYYQYKGTEWLSEGWITTKLSKGSSNIEDDSNPNQHATTAVGYWITRSEIIDGGFSNVVIS
jgi:hypothetical protein